MKAVIQRVQHAAVAIGGKTEAEIARGLLVLLGVTQTDTDEVACSLARKVCSLRVFEDEQHKMNRSVSDVGGEVLVVSQFTLYGDCSRGRRPDFLRAAAGDVAEPLYERFCEEIERSGLRVARGVFGARMAVELVNDGPVTLIVESRQ